MRLHTPTRLSEQNGVELHISLASLNNQPETFERDSEWEEAQQNTQLSACICVSGWMTTGTDTDTCMVKLSLAAELEEVSGKRTKRRTVFPPSPLSVLIITDI